MEDIICSIRKYYNSNVENEWERLERHFIEFDPLPEAGAGDISNSARKAGCFRRGLHIHRQQCKEPDRQVVLAWKPYCLTATERFITEILLIALKN